MLVGLVRLTGSKWTRMSITLDRQAVLALDVES
jgi:hypothetical protein